MVLERQLGQPVPLDLIDMAMRFDEVVAALSGPPSGPTAEDARPAVFLLPGLDDDEERLARFRVALRPYARFRLVAYPDWPEMMRPGWCFDELTAAVVEQIVQQAGSSPILLTGYSFGGEVGFEVACRLVGLGHEVRWFGILDADITRLPPPPSGGPVARLRRYARELADDVRREGLHKSAGLLIGKFGRDIVGLPRMHRIRRWLRRLPPRTEFWLHRRTRSILRMKALWAWQDAGIGHRLHVPVTLFASEAGNGLSPPDRGWGPLCSALTIVPVEGDHHTLFDRPHCEILYARYAEVFQAVTRQE